MVVVNLDGVELWELKFLLSVKVFRLFIWLLICLGLIVDFLLLYYVNALHITVKVYVLLQFVGIVVLYSLRAVEM